MPFWASTVLAHPGRPPRCQNVVRSIASPVRTCRLFFILTSLSSPSSSVSTPLQHCRLHCCRCRFHSSLVFETVLRSLSPLPILLCQSPRDRVDSLRLTPPPNFAPSIHPRSTPNVSRPLGSTVHIVPFLPESIPALPAVAGQVAGAHNDYHKGRERGSRRSGVALPPSVFLLRPGILRPLTS